MAELWRRRSMNQRPLREIAACANGKRAYYDEVDVVEHDAGDGKTCWFHAQTKPGDHIGMNASRVPPPNEGAPPPGKPSAARFWWTPAATAGQNCIACHDGGPTMYSPWLGQEWQHVPTDPWGHYVQVGINFADWHSEVINAAGNACTSCHRIGNHMGCSFYTPMAAGLIPVPEGDKLSLSYPLDHWMPLNNNQSRAAWTNSEERSVRSLMTCCRDANRHYCSLARIK
jgi:hypothetical protein